MYFLGVLWTVLFVILCILLGIIGLFLLLLAVVLFCRIKYDIIAKKAHETDWDYHARIRWLWGGFKKEFTRDNVVSTASEPPANTKPSAGAASDRPKNPKEQEKNPSDAKGITKGLKQLDMGTLGKILGYTVDLLKKILRAMRPKVCRIRGRFGAEEPHATGMVLAAIGAVTLPLGIDTQIEGDFDQPILEIDIKIAGYLRLWAIVLPMARYILKPEIRRLVFSRRRKQKVKTQRKDVRNGHGTKQ
ncbi:MAG: hypothetical protein FWC93_01020 [Defluviitaleaceae bacterium]|nr:hypothetical protein [Defluviitaleaceae bacterium]